MLVYDDIVTLLTYVCDADLANLKFCRSVSALNVSREAIGIVHDA